MCANSAPYLHSEYHYGTYHINTNSLAHEQECSCLLRLDYHHQGILEFGQNYALIGSLERALSSPTNANSFRFFDKRAYTHSSHIRSLTVCHARHFPSRKRRTDMPVSNGLSTGVLAGLVWSNSHMLAVSKDGFA